MLYLIDLESYKERYTYWWKTYLPAQFRRKSEVTVIEGQSLSDTVDTGTVLDAAGTNSYKASQLKQICKLFKENKIKNGDVFFICDIWFPGVEMIRYMSDLYKINVRIYGVWHAGSITMGDFASVMHDWSKYFEIGFLNLCDRVYVGSEYSKQSIIERLLNPNLLDHKIKEISEKISAFGMPIDYDYLQQFSCEKENIILFPHRPDPEKGIDQYLSMIEYLSLRWKDFNNYHFIFCTSRKLYEPSSKITKAHLLNLTEGDNIFIYKDLSKEDYYKLLGRSKFIISTTIEENFGYCIVEGMSLGCIPIVPNDFSYPEILEKDDRFLYNSYEEACDKIMSNWDKFDQNDVKKLVKPYSYTVDYWV